MVSKAITVIVLWVWLIAIMKKLDILLVAKPRSQNEKSGGGGERERGG